MELLRFPKVFEAVQRTDARKPSPASRSSANPGDRSMSAAVAASELLRIPKVFEEVQCGELDKDGLKTPQYGVKK